MASVTEPRASFNKTALAVAWLTLAAAIAAAGGYLVVARQSPPQSAFRHALPEPAAAMMTSADPAGSASDQPADRSADQREKTVSVADKPASAAAAQPAMDESEASRQDESPAQVVVPDQSAASGRTDTEGAMPDAPPSAGGTPETTGLAAGPAGPEDQPSEAAGSGAPEPGGQLAAAPGEPAGSPTGSPTGSPPDDLPGEPLWRQFATAVDVDRSRPRIAVVVSGLGLSSAATEAAIDHLPAYVTLSFSPYARRLNQWIALARAKGHEVMLDLPMEPIGYPNLDPGPHALLTSLDADQNLERLNWILRRGTSIVGLAATMGSRFIGSEDHLYPVMKELKQRGLLFLDNRAISSAATRAVSQRLDMPLLVNDRAIDEAQASRVAIDSRLAQIEHIASTNGAAVAMGQPYPVTIERLRDWTALLGAKGFALVPITALVPEAPSG